MKKEIGMCIAIVFLISAVGQIIPAYHVNNPSEKPTMSGPTSGETGTSYIYTAVSTDPDGDKIFYCFNWGDGTEFCTNLYNSDQQASASHTWDNEGDYTITVKATDEHEAENEAATLKVSMPLAITQNPGTHTVLAEITETSLCPTCATVNEKVIPEVYPLNEYPFYYVALVTDMNLIAARRAGQLSNAYVPMLYLDGGYIVEDENSVAGYTSSIAQAAEREVHPLSLDISASWEGDAKIDVTVSVTNEGTTPYIGHLRVYVTEIISRWNDQKGNPFKYAFLDYAFNKYVRIQAGDTYTETTTWEGSADHGGLVYDDIDPDNIMIIGAVSHWLPHLQENPWTAPRPFRFLAQFVDQTTASLLAAS